MTRTNSQIRWDPRAVVDYIHELQPIRRQPHIYLHPLNGSPLLPSSFDNSVTFITNLQQFLLLDPTTDYYFHYYYYYYYWKASKYKGQNSEKSGYFIYILTDLLFEMNLIGSTLITYDDNNNYYYYYFWRSRLDEVSG